MIGIADPKLWNLGVGLLSKWNGLTFSFDLFIVNGGLIKYSMPGPNQHIFLFYGLFAGKEKKSRIIRKSKNRAYVIYKKGTEVRLSE